jgi:predicted secreted Zn-dependent protease
MKFRCFIPLLLAVILFYGNASCAEISQYFDSEGNSLPSGNRRGEYGPSYGIQRYSIPEGIELQKDIRYEFYPVFGKTFSEIVRSAEENSPVDQKNKKRLPSRSGWTLGWNYKLAYSYGIDEEERTVHAAVEIYDANIIYHITILLPTLLDDSALNPAEKTLWKNYYLRLLEYEHDHAKIIRDNDAQKALIKKFNDLNYVIFDYSEETDIQKTVETFIQRETEKTGSEWVKNLKKRSEEYEKVTEYGFALQKRDSFFIQKEK